MSEVRRPVGRPRRFAEFETFEAELPDVMEKRPKYYDRIGIFKGANSTTAWVKVRLPKGGTFNGRAIPPGGSIEIKIGMRSSWDWPSWLAERDRYQALADRGEPLEAFEVATFGLYAEEWLERRKPTLKGYGITKGHIASALKPTFGKQALNAISPADVNRWIGQQRAKLAPATVQRQLATFNAIMNDAVRSGVIERNPSERADRIRGIEPRQRFVTNDEWQQILKAADAIEAEQDERMEQTPQQIRGWLRHYVSWAHNSGMRRAEILGLTWDHIRHLSKDHVVVEVGNTKTGKPRFVTCTDEMMEILASLARLKREKDDRRLFPVSMTTLKRTLTKLWRTSGLNDVRLHDLRRTHATILLQKNIDPRTVAGRLGHSGTSMLAKHYAVDLGDKEAAKAFSRTSENDSEPSAPADRAKQA